MRSPRSTSAGVVAVAAVLAALLALAPATVAGAAPATREGAHLTSDVPRSETLEYDWRLGGFLGAVAGLFLPNTGEGVMSVEPVGDGELRTELLITSASASAEEYWRYGSRIEADTGHALEAWNSYRWRDKRDDEQLEVDAEGVRDIVSAIYHVRRELPRVPTRMRVWSDGKIYPVVAIPRGLEQREIDGRRVTTVHYTVKGYDVPGGRVWKGSLELWLARDRAATPLEMHIRRSLANLRLRLRSLPEGVS